MKRLFLTSVLLGVMGLVVGPVSAQEKKEPPVKTEPKKDAPKAAGEKGAQPTPSPEELAMMENMMKMGQPGEHHKALTALAGKWNCTGKFRHAPEAPWEEMKSTAEFTPMFDGRFLVQKVKGEPFEMPGMPPTAPFEGFGILGYDNGTSKHTSFWMDNMATMTIQAEGTCSGANCKEITTDGAFKDCMTGKPSHMKSIYKIESNDKFTLSMFMPGPDGKDFLGMEIAYARAK